MGKPFDYRSVLLMGMGMGLIAGGTVLYSPATIFLYFLGIVCVGAGFIWGIYNSFAYRREIQEPTVEMALDPGEQILNVFPGGHRIAKFSASIGKWCITDQRLIYEGSKPKTFGSEPDTMSFPLKTIVNLQIVKAGTLDKFLEVTLTTAKDEKATEKVQIVGRKVEDFKDKLQEAVSKTTKKV